MAMIGRDIHDPVQKPYDDLYYACRGDLDQWFERREADEIFLFIYPYWKTLLDQREIGYYTAKRIFQKASKFKHREIVDAYELPLMALRGTRAVVDAIVEADKKALDKKKKEV